MAIVPLSGNLSRRPSFNDEDYRGQVAATREEEMSENYGGISVQWLIGHFYKSGEKEMTPPPKPSAGYPIGVDSTAIFGYERPVFGDTKTFEGAAATDKSYVSNFLRRASHEIGEGDDVHERAYAALRNEAQRRGRPVIELSHDEMIKTYGTIGWEGKKAIYIDSSLPVHRRIEVGAHELYAVMLKDDMRKRGLTVNEGTHERFHSDITIMGKEIAKALRNPGMVKRSLEFHGRN